MIIDEDVYLEHWGVKGMRWGIRNKRQNSNSEKESTSSSSSDNKDGNDEEDFDDDDLEMFMRRERYKKAAFFVGSIAAGALASVAISKIATKNAVAGEAFTAAKSVKAATTPTMSTIKQYAIPNQRTTAPPRSTGAKPNWNLSFNSPPPPPHNPRLGYKVPRQYPHFFSSRPTNQTRSKLPRR